jgi:aminomethyltransferase
MPIPTPFHERTSALCTSLFYKDWAGYHSVRSFDTTHEREYFAIRHATGLIDVTPLYKYEVYGPDAPAFLSRIMVRNIAKLDVGRVCYLCWCDADGKVIDDGTVSRLDEDYFRVTSTEANLGWFLRHAVGYRVTVEESSRRIAVLALQGPTSRDILKSVSDADLEALRFFRLTRARVGGSEAVITRTGYTGDRGYEVWVESRLALPLWDALMEAGHPHGLEPAGLDAMDVTRVEAGFLLNGVDYFNANHCLVEARKSTPFELGLGWAVHLKRRPFNGSAALRREKKRGPARLFVGLEIDWDELEKLFAEQGLPPEVPAAAWRDPRPVYEPEGRQVGQATSGAWSPILKKNLALATVDAPYCETGTELRIEITVEFHRRRVKATVVDKPFFDPERKKS